MQIQRSDESKVEENRAIVKENLDRGSYAYLHGGLAQRFRTKLWKFGATRVQETETVKKIKNSAK